MNILNKVTLKSLLKNKTRTIVTIIGIILSAAMICAVTTFVSSIQNYALQFATYSDGSWHGVANNSSIKDYNKISKSKDVDKVSFSQFIGYAEINSKNTYKPYMYVIGAEKENFFDMLPVHLISGSLPTNSGEIILPTHLSSVGGLTYKIGDTITLELGERTLDGYTMWQNNPCYTYDENSETVLNNEIIKVRKVRAYKVVGFYERPSFEEYSAPGFTAITISDNNISNSESLNIYYKMLKPANIYDFAASTRLETDYNTDVLMYSGVSKYNTFYSVLKSLSVIVIALIMFGSVSLIYNAFSISVSERTKQFGLLSSIGATKKQLKKTVLFEAFVVSLVGIPIGILAGIGGIAVTLLIIGNKFSAMMNGNFDIPMRICISWEAVLTAIIVAFVTVLISAFIPSKKSTKISAIEAIRQNSDIKVKKKSVKTSKLTYKLFGLSGVLASKYYKRNRKKYKSTVISLFMSIVLFVSASSFTDSLIGSVNNGLAPDEYDLCFYINDEDTLNSISANELLSTFTSEKYVNNACYFASYYFNGAIPKKYLTDSFIKKSLALGTQSEETKDTVNSINGSVFFVNDEEFKKLIKKYNLKENDYFNAENPLGIALDNSVNFDAEKGKLVTLDTLKGNHCQINCTTLKTIEGYAIESAKTNENGEQVYCYKSLTEEKDDIVLTASEATASFTLNSEKAVTSAPFYISKSLTGHINMIYPLSMMKNVFPKECGIPTELSQINFFLTSENHKTSYKNLKSELIEKGINPEQLTDYAETVESENNLIIIIRVFSYGFIVLISLIAAANVFNTINTNISLRRREFAMLKSVGMTNNGFNRMMNYECLLYGSKSLIFGIPVSAIISYLIYQSFSNGYETSYKFPFFAVCVAVFSVFAVVFSTMLYSMKKIKKDNPIDALKNENL